MRSIPRLCWVEPALIAAFGILLALCVALTGCAASQSYVFSVETGDRIEVKLDASNGLRLYSKDGSFSVKKGGETVIDAMFITSEMRGMYVAAAKAEAGSRVTSDTDALFAWNIEGASGMEHNRIIAVSGTDRTYVIAGTLCEDEILVDAAFGSLTFTKEVEK